MFLGVAKSVSTVDIKQLRQVVNYEIIYWKYQGLDKIPIQKYIFLKLRGT